MSADKRWSDPYRAKPDPRAIVTRHRGRLMAMSEVTSVGLGFDGAHRTVIVVGVVSQDAAGGTDLPADLDGVPVQVRVVGSFGTQGEDAPGARKK